ncbi:unnamed protein product [Ectocarpus sp. 12 AP-2014]
MPLLLFLLLGSRAGTPPSRLECLKLARRRKNDAAFPLLEQPGAVSEAHDALRDDPLAEVRAELWRGITPFCPMLDRHAAGQSSLEILGVRKWRDGRRQGRELRDRLRQREDAEVYLLVGEPYPVGVDRGRGSNARAVETRKIFQLVRGENHRRIGQDRRRQKG